MSKMKGFVLDASGSAKIQTGNRLGEMAQKLWDNGKRALPHGVCAYIGTGGHTSFGGFGPFSRYAGLLQDHVTSAEVVLANGTLTTASATENPDLFWALRGAGASYGIVTQWTFSTLAAPPTVISYHVEYDKLIVTADQAKALLKKWQTIALAAPDNLSVICTVAKQVPVYGKKLYLQFRGTYYGTEANFKALSSTWSSTYSPGNFTYKVNNWYDGLVALGGSLDTSKPRTSINFFAKSIFAKSAITDSQWDRLFKLIGDEGISNDVDWFIEFDRYGGAVSKQAPDYTAFAHRDALISMQFYGGITTDPLPADGIPFITKLANAVDTNPKAAYANYVDPSLTPAQWKQQYFAGHYRRSLDVCYFTLRSTTTVDSLLFELESIMPKRTSARLAKGKKRVKVDEEEAYDDPEHDTDFELSESEQEEEHKPPPRKRQHTAAKLTRQVIRKKQVRGKQGLLADLINMPVDIFTELDAFISPERFYELAPLFGDHRTDEAALIQRQAQMLSGFLGACALDRMQELDDMKVARLSEIKRRLEEMGWSDEDMTFDWRYANRSEWENLVWQPKPLTDRTWANIRPKLIPLLEANREKRLALERDARKHLRRSRLLELVLGIKSKNYLALEFKVQYPVPSASLPPISTSYEPPFPDLVSTLDWPILNELYETDATVAEMEDKFEKHREEIEALIADWASTAQAHCIGLLRTGPQVRGDILRPTAIVYDDGSDPLINFSDDLKRLLRADSFFYKTRSFGYPVKEPLTYGGVFSSDSSRESSFVQQLSGVPSQSSLNMDQICLHREAQEVARVILADMGRPDASYLEMTAVGANFVCGRCHDADHMTWEQLIQHYVQRNEVYNCIQEVLPLFNAEMVYNNVHDPELFTDRPLVKYFS
ncbi:unnamed protein product, partial [Rhizoctonia solani]